MLKQILFLSLFITSVLQAKYTVFYRGFSIAEIDDVNSIHQEYLRLKITSNIYKMITMQPYVCYYFGTKPEFAETKFHKDYQRYLAVFKIILEQRPTHQELLVCGENDVLIKCTTREACTYVYDEAGKPFSKGIITFDENDEIYSIEDTHNHAKVIKVTDEQP